jgi:DNA-binding NarL/FixJ family response regulator
MQNTLLVLTPQASFGELIRQTLEETGRYRVEVAYQAAEGVARCRRPGVYRLIILDGDLDGPPLDQLVADLRAAQPEARLALIPPEGPADPQAIQALAVDGALSKPFYLPALAATIDRLIAGQSVGDSIEAAPIRLVGSSWPEDSDSRREELVRVMYAASALGALLIVNGEIAAEAGCAGRTWSAETLAALRAATGNAADSELVLFRPGPDGAGTVLVYALDRRETGILALVYPPEVTYSQARARVRETAR